MKNLFVMSLAILLMLSFTSSAFALEWSKIEETNHHLMWDKFKRGVTNVLTSPAEIPKQIKAEVADTDGHIGIKSIAALGGTAKGLTYSIGRLGSGLWDMLSCNLSIPRNYQPIVKPDYVCEKK